MVLSVVCWGSGGEWESSVGGQGLEVGAGHAGWCCGRDGWRQHLSSFRLLRVTSESRRRAGVWPWCWGRL